MSLFSLLQVYSIPSLYSFTVDKNKCVRPVMNRFMTKYIFYILEEVQQLFP